MCRRLGPGDLAPLVLLTFVPLARLRREGRLGVNPTSEESSRVLMAFFMLETLREGRVLESRRELQEKGVLEVDCPVCLGCLAGVNGVVTFHVLQCGHRCEDARTCTAPPRPRARVDADAKVDHLTRARALPLHPSQGPRGVSAQTREDARNRRRLRVPALPWHVIHYAHLCDEGRLGVMQVRALAYCYTAPRCSSCFAESLILTTLCVPFVLHPLPATSHSL